jgi:hypothetical protein
MAYLSPFGNSQQLDANGAPLSGGKIVTYLAGTSTPATTYTAEDELASQTNPIILNARGIPANPIWLQGGTSYKLVVTDANDVVLQTVDEVQGINDPSTISTQDQWVTFAGTPTYLSATSFSLAGDQTPTFQVGRRLKSANSGGTIYSTIATSSFGAGVTTITVVNDSGTLDAGLSTVSYGLISSTNTSAPLQAGSPCFAAYATAVQSISSATATKVTLGAEQFDSAGCFAASRFTPNVAGRYQFNAVLLGTATNMTGLYVAFYKNGTLYSIGTNIAFAAQTGSIQIVHTDLIEMNGSTDYVELFGYITGTSPSLSADTASQTCRLSGFLVLRT